MINQIKIERLRVAPRFFFANFAELRSIATGWFNHFIAKTGLFEDLQRRPEAGQGSELPL
jgi:hypothetical protein